MFYLHRLNVVSHPEVWGEVGYKSKNTLKINKPRIGDT